MKIRLLSQVPQGTDGGFRPFPDDALERSIPERFDQQVRAHGDRLALKWPGGQHTYRSLDAAANRLARMLLARTAEAALPVALLFAHGGEALVALLATLKAGRFYVVLDPDYPTERLRYMLAHSGAAAMVCDEKHHAQARTLCGETIELIPFAASQEGGDATTPAAGPTADDLAMILYTSGSTGTPKGVVHAHRSVLADVRNHTNMLRITERDRVLLYASLSFAHSVRTIYASLLNGAALYPFDVRDRGFTELADWVTDNGITVIRGVPTFVRNFMSSLPPERQFPAVRILALGGESMLRADLVYFNRHFPPHCVLAHALGPTESLTACMALIPHGTPPAEGKLPIGHALPGKEVLLRDEAGREVGTGEAGEIAVRSRYLALGYWRDPERTQASFLPDPRGGDERIYLTGDIGMRGADGVLVHLGRKDFQVKIRGFRVDVMEIENVLRSVPGIREAVVVGREVAPGDTRLFAYFVEEPGVSVREDMLRTTVARTLPDFMMPSMFIALDAMPVSPNGKTDRLRLPLPDRDRHDLRYAREAPRSAVESRLAAIWADVLGVDDVGTDKPFLELGGDSLQAARIAVRVLAEFKLAVPASELLKGGTVAQMAAAVAAAQQRDGSSAAADSFRTPPPAPSS